jgi:ribonuclease HII
MNNLKLFDLSFESENIKLIAGVDEAGRGPLAGPIVAASVIFSFSAFHGSINDSKKISEAKRNVLYDWIVGHCISYGIGIIDHDRIDRINILQATLMAMKESASKLDPHPDLIIVDGNKAFISDTSVKSVVKGDIKSFSIAAASILAKVTRDRIMRAASEIYPEYGWERNKAYGTRFHIEALKKYGPSPLHRKTFLKKIFPDPAESGENRKEEVSE